MCRLPDLQNKPGWNIMHKTEKMFVIHYAEVGLKGKNRVYFEKRLARNIKLSLRGTGYLEVKRLHDRILVRLQSQTDLDEIEKRLRKVVGIAHFELVLCTKKDMTAIKEAAFTLTEGITFNSLKVETKRSDKSFPLTSPEISRDVGGYLIEKTGTRADMHKPERTFWIDISHQQAYLYTNKIKGVGGLPVGVSGKVLVMLSGGIDSPVAAWKMIKRGAKAVYIHFYSYPYTDKASLEKVIELTRILAESNYQSTIYLIPFSELQQVIVTKTPSPYRVLIYRRMMSRIAEQVAAIEEAEAVVTGESLAQVASQTLSNLRAIEAVVDIPILRPLIGFDKVDIIEKAEQIGTFQISTLPHQDCCSLFVPKHPATHATVGELDNAEKDLDIEALVEKAMNGIEKKIIAGS